MSITVNITKCIFITCIQFPLLYSAAEAVMKGQSDSILLFHQQNVERSKLEQVRYNPCVLNCTIDQVCVKFQESANRCKVC